MSERPAPPGNIHFESPSAKGQPACSIRSTAALTGNPKDVTCPYCRVTEDFQSYWELVDLIERTPEARDTEPDTITILRQSLAEGQLKKIDGMIVDIQTVNAILAVYDAPQVVANPRVREKFGAMPIAQMALTAWQLVRGRRK